MFGMSYRARDSDNSSSSSEEWESDNHDCSFSDSEDSNSDQKSPGYPDSLPERQSGERMFELRRLKLGDRPVTGQDRVQRLDQFFSGENSHTNSAERPQVHQDDITTLVERRLVSSLMAYADTFRGDQKWTVSAHSAPNPADADNPGPDIPPITVNGQALIGTGYPFTITVQTPSSTEGSVDLPAMPPSSCGETPNQLAADLELKERELTELRSEVAQLKRMMTRSLETQIDIQRAIRQEVAAAMRVSQPNQRDVLAPFARELSHGHKRLAQRPQYTNFPRMQQRPTMEPQHIMRNYGSRVSEPKPQSETRMSQMLKTRTFDESIHGGGRIIGAKSGVVVGPIRRPVFISGPIPKSGLEKTEADPTRIANNSCDFPITIIKTKFVI